ncbi:hypothetical protein GZ77_02805 [Endozoicomonas montiporae]|uniref:Uncharacterized protein n=3 Tax=Endozoicomonas montiporae TaxID=1027273 RepID=A0A081NAT7_9GAMM|nr:hypothetical protein EZMO1_2682 [Endozoicomonas montiporae CL-33]KEQ15560.1 hypothetical protein GZ77_02805 [Endozoicomonas montiporae]
MRVAQSITSLALSLSAVLTYASGPAEVSSVTESNGKPAYVQITGAVLAETLSGIFQNRKYENMHHFRLPSDLTMGIDISYGENTDNKEWPQATFYRFSMFSVDAVKKYTDFLRSGSDDREKSSEGHCNADSCNTESEQANQNALIPMGGDQQRNELMSLSQGKDVLSDLSEYFEKDRSSGFGESILSEMDDSEKKPFADGVNFSINNPLAGLGLTQLAELIKQLQEQNPEQGELVLYVAHIPQVNQALKNKKIVTRVKYQVCSQDPYNKGTLYGCTRLFNRNQNKPGLMLLSAAHKESLRKMLKDTERAGFVSFLSDQIGYDPKTTSFEVYDIFAYIANEVKGIMDTHGFTMDERFIDDSIYISTYTESNGQIIKDKSGNPQSFTSTLTNKKTKSKIFMTVSTQGGNFAKTTFHAENFEHEQIALTPRSVLKQEALKAGYIDAQAMYGTVKNLAQLFGKNNNLLQTIAGLKLEIEKMKMLTSKGIRGGVCKNVNIDWEEKTIRGYCYPNNNWYPKNLEMSFKQCNLLKGGVEINFTKDRHGHTNGFKLVCEHHLTE